MHGLEVLGALDALEEVVGLALALDDGGGLVGEDANLLVGVLAAGAALDHLHDDVLGGDEGELLVEVGADDLGVDDEAVGDVVEGDGDGVAGGCEYVG